MPKWDIEANSSYWSSIFQYRYPSSYSKEEEAYCSSRLKGENSIFCLAVVIVSFILFTISVIFVFQ